MPIILPQGLTNRTQYIIAWEKCVRILKIFYESVYFAPRRGILAYSEVINMNNKFENQKNNNYSDQKDNQYSNQKNNDLSNQKNNNGAENKRNNSAEDKKNNNGTENKNNFQSR